MATFFVLLLLIAAGFAFFTLCSNFLYWYETLNADEGRIPKTAPGPLVCLAQYLLSYGGYFLCVLLVPLGFFWRKAPSALKAGQDADFPPVIFVHGLNNNAAVWVYLNRLLEKLGYNTSTYSYSSFFVPLDKIVAGLDRHIRKVESLHPGKKPIFICHSLGGIMVRSWLLDFANHERIGALFTLGTPHSGSKLAAMAPGALAKNITPKAALISRLREAPQPQGVPCLSFVSPADEAVIPTESLVPPAGWKMVLTRRVGHFSMLFCPPTARLLLRELAALGKQPAA